MKRLSALSLPLFLLFGSFGLLQAQDEGFIYGKVTTSDKKVYEGPIRWGNEEVYWVDVFNASKEENTNLRYLSKEQKEKLDERGMGTVGWSRHVVNNSPLRHFGISKANCCETSSYSNDYTHQFSCQFGEIKSIKPRSSHGVEVELQGGLVFKVDGQGYNDIGANLKVLDKEIGEIEINWSRVDLVEFKSTPSKLAKKFGEPLYGTVQTYGGSFTGYIQWDHDERLTADKLDGNMEDGKVSVAFENIKSIERFSGRSKVILKSGREMEMSSSNDVNSENRGIIITDESGTLIDVPWSEFKKLTLAESNGKGLKKYEDFKTQKEISATVSANGKSLTGKTVIDLDEEYEFELFQGKDGDIEYSIPMRNIKKIEVKSPKSVEVSLKNGKSISLKESQDAGERNQGVLIFPSKNEPAYFPWAEVSNIQFN